VCVHLGCGVGCLAPRAVGKTARRAYLTDSFNGDGLLGVRGVARAYFLPRPSTYLPSFISISPV